MQIAWCPLLVTNYVDDLATANWCDMTGMCTVHILRQFWQHNHNVWLLDFSMGDIFVSCLPNSL